jgi:hypothetical protein
LLLAQGIATSEVIMTSSRAVGKVSAAADADAAALEPEGLHNDLYVSTNWCLICWITQPCIDARVVTAHVPHN